MLEQRPGKEVATDSNLMSPLKNRGGTEKRKRITEVEKLEISGTEPKIARTEKGTAGVYVRRDKPHAAQEEKAPAEKAPSEKASPVADKKKPRGKSSKHKKFKVPAPVPKETKGKTTSKVSAFTDPSLSMPFAQYNYGMIDGTLSLAMTGTFPCIVNRSSPVGMYFSMCNVSPETVSTFYILK